MTIDQKLYPFSLSRCSNENAVAMMKDFEFQKIESFDHMYKIHSCNKEYHSSHLKDEVYGVTSLVVCAFWITGASLEAGVAVVKKTPSNLFT